MDKNCLNNYEIVLCKQDRVYELSEIYLNARRYAS